jgi:hypothetical protein
MKPCKNTFSAVDMPTTSKGNDVKLCYYNIIILNILTPTPLHVFMDFKELVSTSNNIMKNSISVRPCTDNLKDVNNRTRMSKKDILAMKNQGQLVTLPSIPTTFNAFTPPTLQHPSTYFPTKFVL